MNLVMNDYIIFPASVWTMLYLSVYMSLISVCDYIVYMGAMHVTRASLQAAVPYVGYSTVGSGLPYHTTATQPDYLQGHENTTS